MSFALRSTVALIIVVVSLSAPPLARGEKGEIIKEITGANVQQMLEALNVRYSEIKPGYYQFNLGGIPTILINQGSSIQFYAKFPQKTTLTRINEWNAGSRYTRAYLDKLGSPVLEADLDLEGGVSYGALVKFIDKWLRLVKLFNEHLGVRAG